MILTDREIRLSLSESLIDIEPLPLGEAYGSTSVDLTLDPNIRVFNAVAAGVVIAIDPTDPGYDFNKVISQISSKDMIEEAGYLFPPKQLILAWTRERVHLRSSSRLAARVEGKSSLARLGLAIHVTAPTIHAGFEGSIQLEIINHGPAPIKLKPGMRICQLILENTLGFPERGYAGQFQNQLKK